MLTSSPRDANGRHPALVPAVTGIAAALLLVAVHLAARAWADGELDVDALVRLGAKVDDRVAAGQWWRLVTAVYLHAGGIHLALNAAWLALFLAATSALLGPLRAVGTALAAGYLGMLLSFALAVGPSVGASGAVYGLAASLVVVFWRRRARIPAEQRGRMLASLAAATAVLLVFPLTVGAVDHAAHLGGFAAGAALGALPDRRAVAVGLAASMALVTAAALVAAAA